MDKQLLDAYRLIAAQQPVTFEGLSLEEYRKRWYEMDAFNQSIYYARLVLERHK